MRRLVREHELSPADLIQPLFVVHGSRVEREIGSMPGVFHLSADEKLDREIDDIRAAGIEAVILFGLPATKDEIGSENFSDDGIVQRALRRIRERHPDLLLITDVCCCEYTSHGHCGVIRQRIGGQRRHAGDPGPGRGESCARRRGHRRSKWDDGRHGCRNPLGPGCRGPSTRRPF